MALFTKLKLRKPNIQKCLSENTRTHIRFKVILLKFNFSVNTLCSYLDTFPKRGEWLKIFALAHILHYIPIFHVMLLIKTNSALKNSCACFAQDKTVTFPFYSQANIITIVLSFPLVVLLFSFRLYITPCNNYSYCCRYYHLILTHNTNTSSISHILVQWLTSSTSSLIVIILLAFCLMSEKRYRHHSPSLFCCFSLIPVLCLIFMQSIVVQISLHSIIVLLDYIRRKFLAFCVYNILKHHDDILCVRADTIACFCICLLTFVIVITYPQLLLSSRVSLSFMIYVHRCVVCIYMNMLICKRKHWSSRKCNRIFLQNVRCFGEVEINSHQEIVIPEDCFYWRVSITTQWYVHKLNPYDPNPNFQCYFMKDARKCIES